MWGLKETGMSYKQRFVLPDNHWQYILPKVKGSSKNGQHQETLISAFA